MLKEFKEFIARGSLIEFAVGVVMGAAFSKVTEGFMTFIVNPLVGLLGGKDFSDAFLVLKAGTENAGPYNTIKLANEAGAVVLGYGAFLTAVVNFVITGFVMFLVVKAYNKTKAPAPEPAPAGPTEIELLAEIRDALKK
jgi:large conductance mechanosensitive channel